MGTSARFEFLSSLAPARAGVASRLLAAAAARIRVGRFEITLPDGERMTAAGAEPGPDASLIVRDAAMFGRILRGGSIGFAEAYMDGQWETPDLASLLELAARNRRAFAALDGGSFPARVLNGLIHLSRRNTRAQARRNIASHYDLGNAFYAAWLDSTMTYSCALFESPQESLEQAQINKYEALLNRLCLRPDHSLLEIGSGWGGFALHAARETGCKVLGVTLSREQLEESRRRALEAGLAGQVRFELRDYRDIRGQFDRIVSVEMFEAVGERYWSDYFRAIRDCLRPDGRAALQVITIDDGRFADYRKNPDFIQRYIFPGGMLPSPSVFRARAKDAGLVTENESFYGADYAETLSRWDLRVFAARQRLLAMGFDDAFLRMWHYYLAYCQAGFRAGQIDLMQVDIRHREDHS